MENPNPGWQAYANVLLREKWHESPEPIRHEEALFKIVYRPKPIVNEHVE